MSLSAIIFWLSAAILCYGFFGYGLVLWFWSVCKELLGYNKHMTDTSYEPSVTLIVPCYNEADILEQKISNCRSLCYPKEKLQLIFITDGSTDQTADLLKKYPDIQCLHEPARKGKTAAENRSIAFVQTPVVIFSDANAMLNPDAIRNLVKHFVNPKTGCVAGEKRVSAQRIDTAGAVGENLYWRYESILKRLDADCNSAVGAAGELMALRTSLYQPLPEDTLLDDFMQSMLIASSGYRIAYEPDAYATETASANIAEELKRKIRIATGSWQALFRLGKWLSIRKTPLLCFQYFSHRVLRWAIIPFLLILLFLLNLILAIYGDTLYRVFMTLQLFFYATGLLGYLFRNTRTRYNLVFLPYYFCVMHYALLAGLYRYLYHKPQNGVWEKAKRSTAY
ncbi:MAG: glycosyltransferase family 2 protein [Bacteroidota bacterium]|nr:glycosyltransferase family 2 protein [Bacteroidota bacterium]